MKNFYSICCACLLSSLLVSCATMPAKTGALNHAMPWPTRQKRLQTIKHWQLNGAIAIKTSQQGQTASLAWQQQSPHVYTISLYGPLGAGRITLTGTKNRVHLLADNKLHQAKTPEALMQQMLGWQLPVGNLYYWVRGLPAPGLQARLHFDRYHHISQLQQQGWLVTYQRYTSTGQFDLPSLLTLQRRTLNENHSTEPNLTVKIVISQWSL